MTAAAIRCFGDRGNIQYERNPLFSKVHCTHQVAYSGFLKDKGEQKFSHIVASGVRNNNLT